MTGNLGEAHAEGYTIEEWCGPRPVPEDYMPDWQEEERTHLQMYESTTEGTPISPIMATKEELARWLADTNASAFGRLVRRGAPGVGGRRGDQGPDPSLALPGPC